MDSTDAELLPVEPRDRALIERLRAGERDALAELFQLYYDFLARFALQLTGDRRISEDIVQDLFIRLWEQRKTIAPRGPVQRYLYKSVRNAVIDNARSERVRERTALKSVEQNVQDERITEPEDNDALTVAIRRAIAALPEQTRLVFTLHTEHAMAHSEIAAVLGVSIRTSETLVARALQKIREDIAQ